MKAPYTQEEVDELITAFDKGAARIAANQNAAVKLRAAERDLLATAEKSRDLMIKAVKRSEDRELLREVFGAEGCKRFHRFRTVLDTVVFSDMHATDQRWGGLKSAIETIEEVLKQMGLFKPWQIGAKAPEALTYRGVRGRFSPGEKVKLQPEFSGGDPSWFSVEPALPDMLKINDIGEITGVLSPDAELPEITYTVKAGNSAGETEFQLTFGVAVPPPSMLKYPHVKSCFSGEDINWDATYEGGLVKEWKVEPDLPKGLRIVEQTGAIFGVPMEAAAHQEYIVTAINGGGQATTSIKFEVKLAPPVALKYPTNKVYYPMGCVVYLPAEVTLQTGETRMGSTLNKLQQVIIAKVMKKKSNPLTQPKMSYVVEPPLPEGLSLVDSTGYITGSCKSPQEEQTYTVTVSNASGKVSCDVPLAIQLIAPSKLSYPDVAQGEDSGKRYADDGVAYTKAEFLEFFGAEGETLWDAAPKYESGGQYFVGDPMMLTPTVEGFVDEWTVEPALPTGLSLDPKQGVIGGVPSDPHSGTWTVKAKNAEGEAVCEVSFSIIDPPPSDLSYPSLLSVYPLERHMSTLPKVSGRITEFSVEPGLPNGMAIDPKTGEISGIPTTATEEASYTVTAKNDTGSCTADATFSLQLVPPEDLSYPHADDLYSVWEEVMLEPEVTGGATSWTVEPALPEGLSLDPSTGVISGTCSNTADEIEYVVTASNEVGGTSTVLTFSVTAPPPAGLSYPECGDDYVVGSPMAVEPHLDEGFGVKFSVDPAFPSGINLDEKTGAITGTPEVPAEFTAYTVTATNVAGDTSCEICFMCSDLPEEENDVNQKYAAMIESITDLADLVQLEDPSKSANLSDWMVWMVHRAHLNDPTLTDFNFNNLQMPLPHMEPRVAPKLMKAMEHNTHITSLQLVNANMQKPSGHDLANSLKRNKTLQILNIEANNVDSEAVRTMAIALKENTESSLETWRFSAQKHVGEFFGRPVEEALADLVTNNQTITKLGCSLNDPHWRDVINKAIMRNIDVARRRRKRKTVKGEEILIPVEKTLSKFIFKEPPDTAVWDVFEDDDAKLTMARGAVSQQKRVLTKEQLQSAAKAAGQSLKFSEVAPLLRDFRAKLFNGGKTCAVEAYDAYNGAYEGTLHGWNEKNENWQIDVWQEEENKLLRFSLNKQPVIEISEGFSEWLKPTE